MTDFRAGWGVALAGVATVAFAAATNVQGKGPIPLQPLSTGACRTFAPAGWQVTDRNDKGTVFTTASPDGRMIASYAGTAVGRGQVMGLYGPQFRTPETFALWAAGGLAGEPVRQSAAPQRVGPYEALTFAGASRQGYVLVYRFKIPADPLGYGVIMRIAIGDGNDPHSVGVAGAVAATARCAAVVVPSNLPVYHAPDTGGGRGRASGDTGSKGDPFAGTYNAQLGTGWMHDPQTGKPYLIDASADWSDTGPEGAGVYVGKGVDRRKPAGGME
jgi:hypothetical protein